MIKWESAMSWFQQHTEWPSALVRPHMETTSMSTTATAQKPKPQWEGGGNAKKPTMEGSAPSQLLFYVNLCHSILLTQCLGFRSSRRILCWEQECCVSVFGLPREAAKWSTDSLRTCRLPWKNKPKHFLFPKPHISVTLSIKAAEVIAKAEPTPWWTSQWLDN